MIQEEIFHLQSNLLMVHVISFSSVSLLILKGTQNHDNFLDKKCVNMYGDQPDQP